jgi:hypothetical protein
MKAHLVQRFLINTFDGDKGDVVDWTNFTIANKLPVAGGAGFTAGTWDFGSACAFGGACASQRLIILLHGIP